MPLSVLVVDDDVTIRETVAEYFESIGYQTRTAGAATEARRAVALHTPDVALVDLRLPDASGLRLLEALKADDPEIEVIFLTGHGDVATAVQAMQQGASDFLEKPVDLEALRAAVERAAERARMRREISLLRARDAGEAWSEALPAAAVPSLDRLVSLAARNDDAPVLILGETGTGKGFVARRIHELSPRARAPFVEVNCASLSSTFFESELFGHEKGAFTDAKQAKRGLLEVAGRGTAFLDEIGELALDVQPKLLKVIEDNTFRRLGGTTGLRSEARVVCATHQPLPEAVAERRFRADLFYRLQVLTITLPPLRQRPAQIPALARSLLPRGARIGAAALDAIADYGWPGNIRELKNALWRATIVADGAEIAPVHLGLGGAPTARATGNTAAVEDDATSLMEAERRAIVAALAQTGGNRVQTAKVLGIARSTLLEKLKRHAIGD
jgi:two-component system response regulator HydG